MPKPPRNSPCSCGSGKKFKKCCGAIGHFTAESALNREIRMFARVTSENGEEAGIEIENASVSFGNHRIPVLKQRFSLSTGKILGVNPSKSEAVLSVAIDGSGSGHSIVRGNATIASNQVQTNITLRHGKKKLQADGAHGLFAIVRIRHQRDTSSDYVDLIFGKKGQSEMVGQNGEKNRPHVTFHADGNGKFFRLTGFDCEVTSEMLVDGINGNITPATSKINFPTLSATLQLKYSVLADRSIVLDELHFVSK